MANTEDIEARLCAYVDGELDAAGRAEIERHLTTNPQHRTLIDDLIRQRDMLRALPRMRAPLDVAETFNAQLERSALLSHDEWHEPIRISRWPQIRAAAAVLLLVFGLAAVVYYVVPSPNQPNAALVSVAPPAVDATRSLQDDDDSPTTGPTGMVTVSRGQPDVAMTLTEQQQRSMIALSQTFSDVQRRDVMSNAIPLGRQIEIDAFESGIRGGARGEVKVVVAAADPVMAQQRVEQYLQNRRISFEPQVSRSASQQLALEPAPMNVQQIQMRQRQQIGVERVVIPQIPGHPLAQPQDNVAQRDMRGDMREPAAPAARAAEADEQRAENQFAEAAPNAMTDDVDGGVGPDMDAEVSQEQTYFARSMTRREVELLCRDISAAGQLAQVVEDMSVAQSVAPTTAPAEFSAREIDPNQWKVQSLLPFAAQSHIDAPPARFGLHLPMGAAPSNADERVDVVIVVLPEAAPAQKTLTHMGFAEPSPQAVDDAPAEDEPADDSPATAPADHPSSP